MAAIDKIDSADLVYIDESGINKFLYREYARSLRGNQVISSVKGKKYQRVSMIAAQNLRNVIAPLVFNGTTDTKVFNHWIKECLLPELRAGQVVVMDNYVIHKSQITKNLIEKAGCRILFLPPYSPDLNPIENLWAIIKSRIRKISNYCEDFNEAIDRAFKAQLYD